MRWRGRRGSSNIEDRRGAGVKAAAGGGGLLLIGFAVIVGLLGGDPTPLLREGIKRTIQEHVLSANPDDALPPELQEEWAGFVAVVLAETEDTWGAHFARKGGAYPEPDLVMFSGGVNSACGYAASAVGPFYCPNDQKIYIDLNFFQDLKERHDAPGDFAQAYVIAHEVGHHVQHVMGTLEKADYLKQGLNEVEANKISVKTELMADCYAGIWAADVNNKNLLEEGDIEEALNAAAQIGDDTLQEKGRGYVVPDSFTHGSSQQRYQWFQRGFKTSDMDACDTFKANL